MPSSPSLRGSDVTNASALGYAAPGGVAQPGEPVLVASAPSPTAHAAFPLPSNTPPAASPPSSCTPLNASQSITPLGTPLRSSTTETGLAKGADAPAHPPSETRLRAPHDTLEKSVLSSAVSNSCCVRIEVDGEPVCLFRHRQSNDPPIIDNVVTLEPVQLLGSGQGGDVFADATGTLAIKLIMRRAYEEEDSFNARFELGCREGFLLDRLKASGRRPAFYGAFEADDEDILALVSERVPGRPCESWLEVSTYAGDAIRELLKIHRLDVRHDDLRPANFVLAEDEGTVFLVDFGHADYDDRPALLQDEKLKLAKKLFPHLSDDSLARLLDEADAYL